MNIIFSLPTYEINAEIDTSKTFVSQFNTSVRIFTGLIWSAYVYVQELDKKTEFITCYRKVRDFLKLKSILNQLVPQIIRDKISQQKKKTCEDEGEVTIMFIKITNIDRIE